MQKEEICTFYIVRHGETEHNVNKITYGHSESLLTEKGIKQAEEIREKFTNIKFDAIFSSDLLRTQKTAEIIRFNRNLMIYTSPLLRERFYGSFEGKHTNQFKEAFKEKIKESEKLPDTEYLGFKLSHDIESDKELVTRFINKLKEIGNEHIHKTVLIISHAGCMRTFLLQMKYADREQLPHGIFKNCGYIKVVFDGLDFFIKEVGGLKILKY